MTANSEYVNISSDVDVTGFNKTNTAANFIVPLSKPLRLTPDWEVGLIHMTGPNYTYNIMPPWDRDMTVSYWKKMFRRDGNSWEKKGKINIRIRPGTLPNSLLKK